MSWRRSAAIHHEDASILWPTTKAIGEISADVSSRSLRGDVGKLKQLSSGTQLIINQIFQGKARPGKHAADASHVSEAADRCSYFITHDGRTLKKRDEPIPHCSRR
jgi:hypothetical protein